MQQISTNLFSGQLQLENGHNIYFGYEKVDGANFNYWKSYQIAASVFASSALFYCNEIKAKTSPFYPNSFTEHFSLSFAEHMQLTKFFSQKGYLDNEKINPFEAVEDGLEGMRQVLAVSAAFKQVFMVYASTIPVTTEHVNIGAIEMNSVNTYKKHFGQIVMSYVYITEDQVPTTTHYGIFRNPLDFFDVEEKYRKLSLKLHGFGATVALQFQKTFMITTPVDSMLDIFVQAMAQGLYCGTNIDLVKPNCEKYRSLQEKFPPIYHISKEVFDHFFTRGYIHKLAVPGTDFANHMTSLPLECTFFEHQPERSIDLSGHTMDGMRVVVSLIELAKFYTK